MTLQPDPHPRLLGQALQTDPLKLGSCKFNIIVNIKNIIICIINITIGIIINIINITLGLYVVIRPKTFESSFTNKPNAHEYYCFFIFFYAKKYSS